MRAGKVATYSNERLRAAALQYLVACLYDQSRDFIANQKSTPAKFNLGHDEWLICVHRETLNTKTIDKHHQLKCAEYVYFTHGSIIHGDEFEVELLKSLQTLKPSAKIRIFQYEKLMRHSDEPVTVFDVVLHWDE